jgi:hypothetical protein
MDLTTIAHAVKGFAPALGAAVGSPLGGVFASLIANSLGVDKDKIADKIKDDPLESRRKITELELDHQIELAKIAAQNYLAEIDDRKDARAKLGDNKEFLKNMAYLLAAGMIGFVIIMYVYPHAIPENGNDVIYTNSITMIVMAFVSKWKDIMSLFSGGKKDKD